METKTTEKELITKMVVAGWDGQNNNFTKLLNTLTDEQLMKEVAPGKNTGIYLLGHLVAVSDRMLPLLGFGEQLFPELENIFISSPDKSDQVKPPVAELKKDLEAINAALSTRIRASSPEDWLERHTAVSEEDFLKEPHRNKLNILISRTGHMAYHLGQMMLLKN